MKNLYIFDLDGTLYEGTDHFDYYAELLMQDVPVENREAFWKDYEKMKAGEHPVAIGKAYDVENDLAVTVDPLTLKAVEAHKWNGEKVEDPERIYGEEQLVFDFKRLVAIGDGWWLPFASAKHYGVKDCYPRYLQTKEYMVSEEFTLEAISGLREFLLELRERHDIVLMTNSDREDVLRLLGELDLTGVFEHVITSAQKPSRTQAFFEELQSIYKIPFGQMISVGDNFINEIAPALLLGMKAVYISEHPHQTEHKDLYQVNKINDWTGSLRKSWQTS
ncbi:HAD family hydrolase [Evansella sp. LMS18]|uniref:HAD family hydrolase n=1 Tax=Evansella sp. LMS18 TaxID=2924033 RepID=UPI0020D1809A|nr:HAD family hydrolase [Evansella sp. LMS18]UTR12546.1 HAD family hydrolase [Evansella sp. LMS18]